VVDGSTDGTADLLRATKLDLPGFRIIKQANGGRAKVRNRGANEATGDILVFLDDDMVVPAQWLSGHVEHHKLVNNSLLCGRLEAATMNQVGEFIVFEEWQNAKWNKGIAKNNEEVIRLESPYLTANNFSISNQLFSTLGQFDARLNDAEDYDLAVRAFQENYPIYFSSKAFAYHNDMDLKNFKSYIQRLRQYMVAQEKLIQYKPELYARKDKNERFPVQTGVLKLEVFKFFAKKYWIKAMEKGDFKWLPKNVRCKIYDIIVTANGVFFPEKVPL
jgi:glycosyltransferase involved in cell wall biosynthesis